MINDAAREPLVKDKSAGGGQKSTGDNSLFHPVDRKQGRERFEDESPSGKAINQTL